MKAFVVAALLGLFTATAQAAPPFERGGHPGRGHRAPDAPSPRAVEPRYDRNEAAQIVRERVGQQILSVGDVRGDARPAYRVKVLRHGKEVRVIYVDANTGEIMD